MNTLRRYDILQRLGVLIELMDDTLMGIPTEAEDPLCDDLKFNNFKTTHEIVGEYISMVMNREYEEEK